MKISFSKTPDDVYLYSFNGNHEWHMADHNKYALENMKFYIGGVTDLAPIVHFPTAEGYVKNVILEEIFKPQSGMQNTAVYRDLICSSIGDNVKHHFVAVSCSIRI